MRPVPGWSTPPSRAPGARLRHARAVSAAAAAGLTLAGCATASPPAGIVVDYQLGGAYEPAAGIGGVVRDQSDEPAPGLWSACYVNGFQTQPQERYRWLVGHPDLVLRDEQGEPVADEGWPDELLLDTSTADKRGQIVAVLDEDLQRCAAKGFDAVDVDNLDSWTRSGTRLTSDDALALAGLIVEHAHALGLAVGQKNAAELGARGRDEAGFDFAVAEQCVQYDECAAYTDVYGEHVVDIEYGLDDEAWAGACKDPQRPFSTILRDHDLSTPAEEGYVLRTCGTMTP